jgi:hypothetical protein
MKLENKFIEVQGGIGVKSYNASISSEDMQKMWDMLQNPYKNSIGSIVREITSNCFDSHAEAGVTDAVRIKYGKDDSGFYVSFIDVGVGLSPTSIENIFLKYLKSTKENSNQFIGAFGLGSKSPLSYQDFFYINTRFEGIEYNYMMYKGEQSPKIDLLKHFETTERNGTEIKIQIKSESDLLKFLNETFTQLHYFKNVVIDVEDISLLYSGYSYNSLNVSIKEAISRLTRSYTLFEGDNFIVRTNTKFNELHLCIGSVTYPIDWSSLKINRIDIPIAVKFDIGELPVIQTREDIRYTDSSIKTIVNKIELVKQELTELKKKNLTKDFTDFDDFLANHEIKLNFETLIIGDLKGDIISLDINKFINTAELPSPQIKGFPTVFKSLNEIKSFVKLLNITLVDTDIYGHVNLKNDFIKNNFKVNKKFNSGGALQSTIDGLNNKVNFNMYKNSSYKTIISYINKFKGSYQTFIKVQKDQNYTTKKNRYIQEVLFKDVSCDNIYFVEVSNKFKLSFNNCRNLLDHFKDKRVIKYLLNYLKVESNSIIKYDYNTIQVDEKWWKDRQAANKNVVDYDRTLMAIETFTGFDWDRKNFRPDLQQILKYDNSFKILITKEEQKILCSDNNQYTKKRLEKLIYDLNILNHKCKYVKHKFILYATSTRNYEKILKNRGENKTIFTLQEFIKDKKMQTRVLSKLVTVLKIKENYNSLMLHTGNLSHLKNSILLFNKNLQDEYNYLKTILNDISFQLNTSTLKEFLMDIDDMDKHLELYDTDLINRFNSFAEFIIKSNVSYLPNDGRSYLIFVTHYKPISSKFRLSDVFCKKEITEDLILEVYNSFYNSNLSKFPEIEYKLQSDGVYYSSNVNVEQLVLHLLYKKLKTQNYIPLIKQDLYLDLSKKEVEEIQEVEEIEEIEII